MCTAFHDVTVVQDKDLIGKAWETPRVFVLGAEGTQSVNVKGTTEHTIIKTGYGKGSCLPSHPSYCKVTTYTYGYVVGGGKS